MKFAKQISPLLNLFFMSKLFKFYGNEAIESKYFTSLLVFSEFLFFQNVIRSAKFDNNQGHP